MSDEPRIDPLEAAERLADERLRLYPSRSQTSDATYQRPIFVEKWLCRRPACGNLVDVTLDAVEIAAQCDGWLATRVEPKLSRSGIVFCDECEKFYRASRGEASRKRVDAMRSLVVELKQCKNPEGERDLMLKLRASGHPDVDGLVLAIRTRLDGGKQRQSRRDL